MDYRFSDAQRCLVEEAFAFARDELAPHADAWDRDSHFPLKAIARAASRGYLGLTAGPDHGGLGLGALDASLVLEQLATGCGASAAFMALHTVAVWTVGRFGGPELKAHWLPRLVAGEARVAFALSEGPPWVKARRDGDEYRLEGLLGAVPGAAVSDLLLMDVDIEGDGATLCLLPAGAEGVGFGEEASHAGWRAVSLRPLRLDGVTMPASQRLGGEGQRVEALRQARDRARLALAAVAVGNAQAALAQALRAGLGPEHPQCPSSSAETVPQALAEPYAALIAGQQLVRLAAAQVDHDAPQAGLLCAAAKRYTDLHGPRLCRTALQLQAGYGYLDDHAMDRRARDSDTQAGVLGNDDHLRAAIASRLRTSQALYELTPLASDGEPRAMTRGTP